MTPNASGDLRCQSAASINTCECVDSVQRTRPATQAGTLSLAQAQAVKQGACHSLSHRLVTPEHLQTAQYLAWCVDEELASSTGAAQRHSAGLSGFMT